MAHPPAGPHKHTNRLARATSPYLLQHAHNPVDWYPWGLEAIDASRSQNKPIFLSVGYSTCYWCHVMERQSFENEEIAAQMNERFINIKVDREERPDVDQIYMTAVQVLTRQGGWPMSVFLTPDLKPFFGGTYFPPNDGYGRPGFPRVVQSLAATFHTKRDQVERSADEIVRIIRRVAEPRQPTEPLRVDLGWVESLIERSTADYEQCFGGYGTAPKFPRQTLLEMLVTYCQTPGATEDAEQIKGQVLYTLDFMAEGGIRDHLGGGFHRYSTDEKWLVPHFEIMLYDQAMLAVVYTRAWQLTSEPRYAKIARGILDFVLREMTSPAGPFYTAFDAEVDAQEGLSYLWTADEVRDVLVSPPLSPSPGTPGEGRGEGLPRTPRATPFSEDDISLFLTTYALSTGPNFADPHHGTGQPDKNILHLPTPLAEVAKSLNITEDQLDARLEPMRQALYTARLQRKQPLLDTKILTSWNALMIRAFAVAGRAMNDPRYTQAATRAAQYLLDHHRQADGSLVRTTRPDAIRNPQSAIRNSPIPGFLDDHAFLAHACLALHDATADESWRHHARHLIETTKSKFLDPELGGFFFSAVDQTDLIVRQKLAQDSPLPSGNAVAAMALVALGDHDAARQTLAVFAQSLEDSAEGMSSMLHAALQFLEHHEPFTVSTADESGSDRPATPDQLAKSAVDLSAEWESPTELRVTAKVLEPFHLNSNRPAPGLIPTTLTLATRAANPEVAIDYPPGEERKFVFADQPLHVYDDTITIVARLSEPLSPGTAVRATLVYQPCTEDACLPATTKQIEFTAP